jgi:hypothetical protein
MSEFKKEDKVYIRDYPFGKPLRVSGEIVGILRDNFYNVRIYVGAASGKIVKYKYWKLMLISDVKDDTII